MMREKVHRALEIYSQAGLISMLTEGIQYVFNQKVAPYTPRTYQLCNGVIIRNHKIGEILSSAYDTGGFRRPTYEDGLKQAVADMISTGDDVVVLGAGAGVVTTYVSRFAGESGHVFAYEASIEMVRILEETIDRNQTAASVDISHAAVGEVHSTWGELGDPEEYSVNDIPSADIFVIDVEGAEKDIIKNLPNCRGVIVETHGVLGSPTDEIKESLSKDGFEIRTVMIAEPSRTNICKKNDIRIVVASQDNHKL
jgi:precorrin-6B methylase 2